MRENTMAKDLTDADFALLQTYIDTSDRVGYYTVLAEWGYGYPALALGVVNNDTLAGATANEFFTYEGCATGCSFDGRKLCEAKHRFDERRF